MSKHYVVSWSIDIFDADTPEEAARLALGVMEAINPSDPDGANVFEVSEYGGASVVIDLGAKPT